MHLAVLINKVRWGFENGDDFEIFPILRGEVRLKLDAYVSFGLFLFNRIFFTQFSKFPLIWYLFFIKLWYHIGRLTIAWSRKFLRLSTTKLLHIVRLIGAICETCLPFLFLALFIASDRVIKKLFRCFHNFGERIGERTNRCDSSSTTTEDCERKKKKKRIDFPWSFDTAVSPNLDSVAISLLTPSIYTWGMLVGAGIDYHK